MNRSQSAALQPVRRRSRGPVLTLCGASLLGLALLTGAGRSTGPIIESSVEGHVTRVDPQGNALQLDSQRRPVEVSIRAYITRNGEPAKLADIQPGDDVRAGYLSGEPIHAMRVDARSGRQPASGQSPGAGS